MPGWLHARLIRHSTTSFAYDAENRLTSASGGRNVNLSYDPLGRLWQVSGGPSGTTRFLYDGDALVAEYDQWGNMLKRYVHGQGADTPQLWFEGTGTSAASRRYLFTNHQGSVTAITDGNGNTIAINRYDEYGIPGTGNIGRFQYTGQAWLEDLGMYHYKARIYSPTLGRFLQTDPIGYEDQINLYAYVGNDPVNMSDPTGMAADISSTCSLSGRGTACAGSFGGDGTNPRALIEAAQAGQNGNNTNGSNRGGQKSDVGRGSGHNPLSGSLNPLAEKYGELTADLDSGAISADDFAEIDADQGNATAQAVGTITVVGSAVRTAKALQGAAISDVVRWGPTVVSNQVLIGRGVKGASVRWTIKGGGGPFRWKYHIGSYN